MYSRLDQQRERYGAFLFIRDERGLHNCFFKGCGQSYRHNFSRHISQHEKWGDEVDLEFVEKQRQRYQNHPEAKNPTWRARLEKRQKEPFFRCKEIIEKMRRQRNAWPFLAAVDPDKMGLPDYYDIIKEPMDLGTVAKKLEKGEYADYESFAYDVRLIFNNARTYNPPDSQIYKYAEQLSRSFEIQFAHIMIDVEFQKIEKAIDERFGSHTQIQLTFSECTEILDHIKEDPRAVHFINPIEPEAVSFADYYKTVKYPMDLSTVTQRLLSGRYPSFREFANDMRQIWKNAFMYFSADEEQYQAAEHLAKKFEALLVAALERAEQRAKKLPEGQPYCFNHQGKLLFWDFENEKYYYEEFPLDHLGREKRHIETEEHTSESPSMSPPSKKNRLWPTTKQEKIEQRLEDSKDFYKERMYDPIWNCWRYNPQNIYVRGFVQLAAIQRLTNAQAEDEEKNKEREDINDDSDDATTKISKNNHNESYNFIETNEFAVNSANLATVNKNTNRTPTTICGQQPQPQPQPQPQQQPEKDASLKV
jgi:hypothetical protein